MARTLFVAITTIKWVRFLADAGTGGLVNHWSPAAKPRRPDLQPGDHFLFRVGGPVHQIVGGGIFDHHDHCPARAAWQRYGTGNGSPTADDFFRALGTMHHGQDVDPAQMINCRVLSQPFFLAEQDWFEAPGWGRKALNKKYTTATPAGQLLWEALQERLGNPAPVPEVPDNILLPDFRERVMAMYGNRCAITGEKTVPALAPTTIQPLSHGGIEDARNSLLLRRDIQSLFDEGYVTVTPELEFKVSTRIRSEFDNGFEYYRLAGKRINVPTDSILRPHPDHLGWHNSNRYRDQA